MKRSDLGNVSKAAMPPGIVPPRAAQCTRSVLFAAFGGNILTILAASRQLFARPSSILRRLCRHISLSAIFNG